MKIDFAFACRDDCLDLMVPSDLRILVAERDRLKDEIERLRNHIKSIAGCIAMEKPCDALREVYAALLPNAPGHGAGGKETSNEQ